ncbi:hypothetical protein B9Z55_009171 [Caenorhabditis nigoni]|nr:hypothetical protein B9Z55_009171 [Caenorhabditis nigoni]
MKKFIKSSQTTRFQSISRITYSGFANKWYVWISYKSKNMYTMEEYEGTELIMTMSDLDYENYAYFQLNVSGKKIDFRVPDEYPFPEACFHPSHKESTFASIHNHLLDLFGDTVEYIWITPGYKYFIPQLPNLLLCVNIWPDRSEMVNNLEAFFNSSPTLKHINIKWIKLLLISPESRFYQAESIRIIKPRPPTVNIFLRNFKGRQATLFSCECEVSDLIEFMNRWRSGEHSGKLEYLSIRGTFGARHRNGVLNANFVKHIGPAKKPPTHSVPDLSAPEPALTIKPNTDPITSHFYIVRETDNRVASVSIQGPKFQFGVWKETEEEFLRMVK